MSEPFGSIRFGWFDCKLDTGLVLSDTEARTMFNGADTNGDKLLDFTEFYVLLSGTAS